MTILKDVLAELLGMFLGDARLSAAILAVVNAHSLWARDSRVIITIVGWLMVS